VAAPSHVYYLSYFVQASHHLKHIPRQTKTLFRGNLPLVSNKTDLSPNLESPTKLQTQKLTMANPQMFTPSNKILEAYSRNVQTTRDDTPTLKIARNFSFITVSGATATFVNRPQRIYRVQLADETAASINSNALQGPAKPPRGLINPDYKWTTETLKHSKAWVAKAALKGEEKQAVCIKLNRRVYEQMRGESFLLDKGEFREKQEKS